MLDNNFLAEFKRVTELNWSTYSIDPTIYGFQFQPGTRWNPGLSDQKITEYEEVLAVRFPNDFRALLSFMNGTDLPTLNIYGSCGYPSRESVGLYSYPRDLEIVRGRIADANENRAELAATMQNQGFDLAIDAGLMPIFAHRYIICTTDRKRSVVLSIHDSSDAIVYGNSLQEYLEKEFLKSRF